MVWRSNRFTVLDVKTVKAGDEILVELRLPGKGVIRLTGRSGRTITL